MPRRKKAITWVTLEGNVKIHPGSIRYEPLTRKEGPGTGSFQPGVVRSDQYFESGTVSFQVKLEGPDCRCQLILNHRLSEPREIFIGLTDGPNRYSIVGLSAGKWEPIAYSGAAVEPRINEWIRITIRVSGSLVEMFVEGVLVMKAFGIISKSQLALYLYGSAPIEVRYFAAAEQRPLAFVVMQFTDEFNALYEEVIKRRCEEFGYQVVRADDIYTQGLIIQDIARKIIDASVVIADITTDNPNVFYEVGFAHGINKPTILLADKTRGDLPFDVAGFRTLFYENTIGGKTKVEEALVKHLQNLRSEPYG